jgi:O-antigen/teichoic acid export membrane protein
VKGAYDLCLATVQLIFTITVLSLPGGLTFVVASGKGDVRRWRDLVYGIALLLGVCAACLLLAAQALGHLHSFLPTTVGLAGIAFVSLSVAALAAATLTRALVVGRREFRRANLGDLVKQGSALLLLPAAILLTRGRPAGTRVIVFLAANLCATLCAIYAYDGPLRACPSRTPVLAWVTALRFSLPGFLADLLQSVNYRLGVYYVNAYDGTRAVGLFQSSAFVCQSLWLLPTAMAAIIFPHVANSSAQGQDQTRTTVLCSRVALWSGAACAVPLAIAAPILIPFFFGNAFRDSITLLWLMLPGTIALCPGKVIASHLAGIGRPQWNLYASAAGAVPTIALNALWVPVHGARGAAMAASVSYCCSAIVLYSFFLYSTRLPWRLVLLPGGEELALAKRWLQWSVRRT